ncbi:hypothetical protein [Azospirillum rugosum]|uniref:Uncharacterized protein n=1 Tax=Azospirillum rugosum TaxID=416170 RepID=A0ABS4SI23_9PROT|nr:hypothetical protein [Azospirillum rugosum]MBP2292229.1 hypothetical protein [Azospirillum rugosum]MDQ0525988.1 hypothetical protein [Azospirillum rugosum]
MLLNIVHPLAANKAELLRVSWSRAPVCSCALAAAHHQGQTEGNQNAYTAALLR